MLIKTTSKMDYIEQLINIWLKDNDFYCNHCDSNFDPLDTNIDGHWNPCCDNPQVGRNKDHCMGLIKQNKELRSNQINVFGATEDLSLRTTVSLPPRLHTFLNKHFLSQYQEKLFKDKYEMIKFMKRFPAFNVPEKI